MPAAPEGLPPYRQGPPSLWGWCVVGSSLLAVIALHRWAPSVVVAFYLVIVGVAFFAALPGGLIYQGEVEEFLAHNPGARRDQLPFPADFAELSGPQQLRYAARGIPTAIVFGLQLPVLMLLAPLGDLGLVPPRAFEQLYSSSRDRRGGAG